MLEIGVGGITSNSGYETAAGGQSLAMWSSYFPNAEIVGVDIHAKAIRAPRIHFEQGDQSDPRFLRSLVDKYGPFDIVIDDGSHIGRHIIASIEVLGTPSMKAASMSSRISQPRITPTLRAALRARLAQQQTSSEQR